MLPRSEIATAIGMRMTKASTNPQATNLVTTLAADDESTRLKAALAAGSNPDLGLLDVLVARCATEPDFFVRDMLTWTLTRFPREATVPRLLAELCSERAQARSQALHTLSKIGDASAWPAITRSLLRDADDNVAQSAWRAAVILVPEDQKADLAEELAAQFGRGDRGTQLSLSSALISLGELVIEPLLRRALASDDPGVRALADATARLLRDPNAGFQYSMNQVKRILAPR
jgi:HEAT repeat protein